MASNYSYNPTYNHSNASAINQSNPYGSGDPYYNESTGFITPHPAKKGTSKWIKFGIPVAVVVIAAVVVGVVLGVRSNKNSSSSSSSASSTLPKHTEMPDVSLMVCVRTLSTFDGNVPAVVRKTSWKVYSVFSSRLDSFVDVFCWGAGIDASRWPLR